jgi:hemerythrin-like domain-containing protein
VNIFDLIREDHAYIDGMLERIEEPPGAAPFDEEGRRDLVQRLVVRASQHEAAEEMAFWPRVRATVPGGAGLADEALEQERTGRAQVDLLRAVRSEEEMIDEARRLHGLIREHARWEEGEVFPQLRKHSTRVWASLAGSRFLAASRAGPTRPHPRGPERPLKLMTVGAPAVLLDHLRDRHKRPQPPPPGTSQQAPAPGPLEVILSDHGRISGLLSEVYRALETGEPGDVLVHELIRELSIHDSIERQYLYPALRTRIEGGEDQYHTLLAEHDEVAKLAGLLERYSFHDEARRSWIRDMGNRVSAHMDREETGVLPALAARMTGEELAELGAVLQGARSGAPTRPHRALAGAGPGARLSRRIMAPLDKARDALRGD